jgi:glycosyltransferase involved in cell wall biosynthesis
MTEEGGFSKWHPLVLILGLIEKIGYNNSDLIIGTMPNLSAHVQEIINKNKKVYCLPLGFNPGDYKIENTKTHNPFNIYKNNSNIIVGYAGSMGITNALETFIEAIKKLNITNKNIHFLLVGSGDLRESYISNLVECNNVTFLERINQDQVKYFLEICDILYLSTKKSKVWDYGQSMNKVVEYMLASKPILATYSGYPSMIDEAGCGYYVDEDVEELSNKILEMSKLPEDARLEMGEKGKTWIYKNRSYKQLTLNYINQLEQMFSLKN